MSDGGAGRTVGVVCALPSEARAICRPTPPELTRAGPLLVACSGIGPARAQVAARRLVVAGADLLVSFGTAGGLDPELRPGHALIPDAVLDPDGRLFACEPLLVERLRKHTPRTPVPDSAGAPASLCTSAEVLSSPGDKQRLRARHRPAPAAVDMESAAIAAVAAAAELPFVAIRVVVDDALTALPTSACRALDGLGRFRPLAFAAALARRPWEIGALARLGRDRRRAQRTLVALAAELRRL